MNTDRVVLTGASGFIGTYLLRVLRGKPIQVSQLVRRDRAGSAGSILWDPYAPVPIEDSSALSSLDGTTAAIHLSGANVAGRRWTGRYKNTIRESRIAPTRALALLLARLKPAPRVLISASAVGIYGSRGDETLSEDSTLGNDFLADVCREWESATRPASDAGIRVVHLRLGVVLAPEGGALARMLPLFRLGLGGRLGSGKQWMSWAALSDVAGAIEFALETEDLSGAVNLTAPQAVTNAAFTRALGRVLDRPALLAVPGFALKLALGEMGEAALLASQRAAPERLHAAGFRFQAPELEPALAAMIPTASQTN